jgi:SAM-dependent methyltransferase
MPVDTTQEEWWRDPRCHYGKLTIDSAVLRERDDTRPAIEFIAAELGLARGARILDLCCGPGRHAVELAQRGFDVVGLDVSSGYIALAQQLAEREGVRATFLAGDMRRIPFEQHFDAIINVGTSFGFFDSDAENARAIQAAARALKPQGVFLLEMGNREYYLKHFLAKDWRRLEDGRVTIIQRDFDYERSRIIVAFETLGGEQVERWSHSWRAYTLAEMAGMLEQAGLALSSIYGDWDRSAYGVDSPRMVLVSEPKRAS